MYISHERGTYRVLNQCLNTFTMYLTRDGSTNAPSGIAMAASVARVSFKSCLGAFFERFAHRFTTGGINIYLSHVSHSGDSHL